MIVSPFARAGYTDTSTANFSSMLAYTEHVFGIPALSSIEDLPLGGTEFDLARGA